jgi:hypothetical protein
MTLAVSSGIESPGARRKRWLFTVMGVTFAAQGIGKILAFSAYLAALAAFRFVPTPALSVVGAAWTTAEVASGLALLATGLAASPRPSVARFGAMTALAVSLAYAVLDIQGYMRALPIANCTCFGAYGPQRLSWFVLLQEAYVIFLMAILVRKVARWRVVR